MTPVEKYRNFEFIYKLKLTPNVKLAIYLAINATLIGIISIKTEMIGGFSLANQIRAVLVYFAISGFLTIISGRIIFSAMYSSFLMIVTGIISKLKFQFLHENLIINDITFLTKSEIIYFSKKEPLFAFSSLLIAIFAIILFILGWLLEKRRIKIKIGGLIIISSLVLLLILSGMREEDRARNFLDSYHMTSFFRSFADIPMYIQGAILPYKPSHDFSQKIPSHKKAYPTNLKDFPNIIIILHESTVDPIGFKKDPIYQVNPDFFRSYDGKNRSLIVETYGGGTWISEYGLFLGISTHHFGPIRNNLGTLLNGKTKNALPEYLRSNGYYTAALYPADKNFANTQEFYKSIGFENIYDQNQMNGHCCTSDSEIYNFLIQNMIGLREKGEKIPAFYFVMTAATHFPYNYTAMPERRSSEILLGDEWAEYARRLRLSADDFINFQENLKIKFPDEKFIIVGFGDHQPFITKDYYGDKKNSMSDLQSSPLYDSFFRINAIGFSPQLTAIPQHLEIGLLGTAVIQAAGLPLDGTYGLRADFLQHCGGLIVRCPDQRAVLELNEAIVRHGDLPGVDVDALSCSNLERRGLSCLTRRPNR